jgi:hypothetical protein
MWIVTGFLENPRKGNQGPPRGKILVVLGFEQYIHFFFYSWLGQNFLRAMLGIP